MNARKNWLQQQSTESFWPNVEAVMVILAIPGKERKKSIFETSPYLLVLLPKYANICDIAAFFALGARLKTETELQKQSNRILISDKSIETELGKRQK